MQNARFGKFFIYRCVLFPCDAFQISIDAKQAFSRTVFKPSFYHGSLKQPKLARDQTLVLTAVSHPLLSNFRELEPVRIFMIVGNNFR